MRRAAAKGAQRAADVWLESRRFVYPAVPACIHSDSSVRLSFREEFLPGSDVWVAEQGTSVVEVVFLAEGWIDQLYVTRRNRVQDRDLVSCALRSADLPGGLNLGRSKAISRRGVSMSTQSL